MNNHSSIAEQKCKSPFLDEWKGFVCPVCGGDGYYDAEQCDNHIHGFCTSCLSEIIEDADGFREWDPEKED